jgi:hypothetical protein
VLRELGPDLAGLDLGADGSFGGVLHVLGDPIDERMAVGSELLWRHGDEVTSASSSELLSSTGPL